jgi:hypothetical protein
MVALMVPLLRIRGRRVKLDLFRVILYEIWYHDAKISLISTLFTRRPRIRTEDY